MGTATAVTGALDGVVACAGGSETLGPITMMDVEAWRRTIDLHIKRNAFTDVELDQRQQAADRERADVERELSAMRAELSLVGQDARGAKAAAVLARGLDVVLAAPAEQGRATLREGGLERVEVDAPNVRLIFT